MTQSTLWSGRSMSLGAAVVQVEPHVLPAGGGPQPTVHAAGWVRWRSSVPPARQVAEVGADAGAELDDLLRQLVEHASLARAEVPLEVRTHHAEEGSVEAAAGPVDLEGGRRRTGCTGGGHHIASRRSRGRSHCAPIRPACQAWNYPNFGDFEGWSRWAAYQAAICARDRKPRRRRMRSTCPSAERSSMPRRVAISRFVQPSLTRAATSRWRAVSVSGGTPCAGARGSGGSRARARPSHRRTGGAIGPAAARARPR